MHKHLTSILATTFSFLSGLVFGIGLIVAGMANPAKVLAFLDLSGLWDPSLGLVMAGAIAVGIMAFAIAKKRQLSLLGLAMHMPGNDRIDRRLLLGSLAFGVGWGMAGICPAPAFVLLGSGNVQGLIFVLGMLAGMAIYEWLESRHR